MKLRQTIVRAVMLLGVVVMAVPAAQAAAATPSGEPSSAAAARPAAPPTRVTTLDGNVIDLADLKGRVVLIDFWATWCPPCRAELPHFQALYTKYQPRLQILGLAMDQEGASAVAPFVKAQGVTYPIALGTEALGNAYGGIRGIPTTFLIDQQGRIAKKYFGYQEASVFEQDVTALLQER